MHRSVTGDIKTVSIKRDSVGDWFITMTVETCYEQDKSEEFEAKQDTRFHPVRPIGVDVGLGSIITASDGSHIEPKNSS